MARILVAEDSATQALQIRGLLEAAGHQVVLARDGAAALELLAAELPALVLTDLDMPGMTGLELVVAVRRDYPQVPVVLMTAYGSEETAVQALQSGAASYVPKKNLVGDLAQTLDDVLEIVRTDQEDSRLGEFLDGVEAAFVLPTIAPPVIGVIGYLHEALSSLRLGDDTDRMRAGVALDTAIHNLIYFGNLELKPAELEAAFRLADAGRSYRRLLEDRSRAQPYAERQLHVALGVGDGTLRCTLRHEGPGFARDWLLDAGASPQLDGDPTRGWLLVQSFMDEVQLDAAGKELVLVRRFR